MVHRRLNLYSRRDVAAARGVNLVGRRGVVRGDRNNKSKTGRMLSMVPRMRRRRRRPDRRVRYDMAGRRAVDYKVHQLNERRRGRSCRGDSDDEAASLWIHGANTSTERSYVSRSRVSTQLYPSEKTAAIIQQAVLPRRHALHRTPH